MKKYIQEILYLLGNARSKLPSLISLFMGASLLDLAGIGLVGPYIALVFDPQSIDSGMWKEIIATLGLPSDKKTLIIMIGMALFTIFLIKSISSIWINYKILHFGQDQQIYLRSYLMRSYQALPYTKYLCRNSSEYVYNIQTLVDLYTLQVLIPGLRTLSDGIVALAILILLAWQNTLAFALLVGLLGSLIIVYDRVFRVKIKVYGEKANTAATSMAQGIHEGVEGLKEIRILGNETYFYNKVVKGARKYSKFTTKTQVISTAPKYLLELIVISFIITIVIVTQLKGESAQLLLPTLGMFGVAALRLLPATHSLLSNLVQLRFSRDGISRLYSDLQNLEKTKLKSEEFANKNKNIKNFSSLSLKEISYRYPNVTLNALDNISFTIKAGESIGLIGPSGSGKTTLVDMLLGLLDPSSGEILYNGKTMSKSILEWRSQVAYLTQQIFLTDNTMRRNIALGVEDCDIDDSRIQEALRQSYLQEFVEQLPNGVETVLGERGIRLSGGQRQRVALARAFYHGRNVLIMDEATSSLDNETEREIIDEVRKLHGKKTMIVIAHRLTTVQHCDRIYRVEKGRIVQVGTPDEVIN